MQKVAQMVYVINAYKCWLEKLKGGGHVGDLDIDERILLQ
jgi:hypothetical protein